jgi:hypothetical protein
LARIWDVREAALKRCKSIRSRRDYSDVRTHINEITESGNNELIGSDGTTSRNFSSAINVTDQQQNDQHQSSDRSETLYVPPLPVGAEFGAGAEFVDVNETINDSAIPGSFIANDDIDEGVILISRLQHGEMSENLNVQGLGTRSRRKKIKVVCLSRCPIGGHFATGSDDGIGRIWLDDTNDAIEKIDIEYYVGHSNETECLPNVMHGSQKTRSNFRSDNNGAYL